LNCFLRVLPAVRGEKDSSMDRLRYLLLTTCVSSLLSFPLANGQEKAAVQRSIQEEKVMPSEPYIGRIRREGRVLELTLRDVIERALSHNLEITIENFNADINRERIKGAKGFYDPQFDLEAGTDSSKTPTTSILQAGAGISTENSTTSRFGPSLTQNIPGGGSFKFGFSNSRSFTNNTYSFINPLFGSGLDLSFTQPLWRGFLRTSTERQLKILNLDSRIADSQFRQTVSQIIERAQGQYWELVFSIENYEVRRQSRELAVIQYENARQRVGGGLLTMVAVTSARAEIAIREQEMVQAEVRIINAENALKGLLSPAPTAAIWNRALLPIDEPRMQELTVTLEEAVRTAILRRPEIEQSDLALDQNAVERKFLKRENKPVVNLTASLSSVGRSGNVFQPVFGDAGIEPTSRVQLRDNPSFGGYPTSWRQVFGFNFPTWGLSLDLRIPLRNRALDADLAEAVITRRKLLAQRLNEQQKIIVEVRNAYREVELQKKGLDAARLARELSEEQLRSEMARFEVGFTTNFEVLRYQRDLADARVRELRALVDHQLAVTTLQKAMDEIVGANDIVLARQR
jgi:outer membrane protein TolC